MGGKWSYIGFYFLSLLLFLIPSFMIQESLAITNDGLALLEFRARIDFDPYDAFANWDSNDTTPCTWFGVHCVDSKVQILDLSSLDLEGTLAPELGKLTNLRSLVLCKNHFSGVIPKEFGELTNLELLDLRDNKLGGTIPAEMEKMPSLNCLLLYDNQFEGGIPSNLGRLKLLPKLQFDENLASTMTTGIGCSNRKFGLCIWQSSCRLLNGAGSFFIPIKGAISRYLNGLPIQWFKLLKDTLAEHFDRCCGDVHGSSEQQLVCNVRNLVVPSERRRLLEQSRNLPAAKPLGVTSTEQIIALPSTRSSGSFPAVPNGNRTRSKPANQSSQSMPADQSSLTSNAEEPSTFDNKWKYFIIIPFVVIFIVFVVLVIICRKRTEKAIGPWHTGLTVQLQNAFVTGVPKLNRAELDVACEDFSNVVSLLGGCTMYKGILSSGVEIAVASVCVPSLKGWSKNLETVFRRKIDRLSRINHKNFVNLIGYCEEDEPFSRMMVLEYSPNGSLFDHLHSEEMEHLDWSARVRIIMGVVYCLVYLHHDMNPPMSLPKISTTLVYLTDDYAAKVVEPLCFEALTKSKNKGNDGSEHSVSAQLDDPESNVYNFGILLLETISGRFVQSEEYGPIEDWAAPYLNDKGSQSNMVDPTLKSFKSEELEAICEVIQLCIQTDPRQRPTMMDVSTKLKQATNIPPQQAVPRLSPLWWAELEILSMKSNE